MSRLMLRVDFAPATRLGPGKVRLLEAIEKTGSISAAGRLLRMSYRRAWLLVDEVNDMFREAAVETASGGKRGGGARLTELGREIVRRYRAIEEAAAASTKRELAALDALRLSPQ